MYTRPLGGLIPYGTLGAAVTTATGVLAHRYIAMENLAVRRAGFLVTTAINGAATIAVKKRPTHGSATGESTIATLTIPTATAVGQVVYKDFEPVKIGVGQEVCFDVTSASATAGAGVGLISVCEAQQYVEDQTKMVESA